MSAKSLFKGGIVSVITLIAALLPVQSVSAWHYQMSGSGACQSDGSYKITWKVDNTSEPTQLEVKQSSNTDVVKVGETIPARSTEDFYQTVDGDKPGTFKLELTADWKEDRNNMKRSATVQMKQACEQPVEKCDVPGKGHLPKNDPACKDTTGVGGAVTELPKTGSGTTTLVVLPVLTAILATAFKARSLKRS